MVSWETLKLGWQEREPSPLLKAKMMANLGECTLLLFEKEHTIVPQNEVPKIAEIR